MKICAFFLGFIGNQSVTKSDQLLFEEIDDRLQFCGLLRELVNRRGKLQVVCSRE